MNHHAESIRLAVKAMHPFKAQISKETHTQLFDWYHTNKALEHITFNGSYTGRIYYDGVLNTIAITSTRRDQHSSSRNDYYDDLVYVEIVDPENSLNGAAIVTESQSNMKRTITEEEIDLRNTALRCRIKLDFLTKKVSYVKATELSFLVNECRQTDAVRKQIRQSLRAEFDAVYVAVGNGNVAIVKRFKSN